MAGFDPMPPLLFAGNQASSAAAMLPTLVWARLGLMNGCCCAAPLHTAVANLLSQPPPAVQTAESTAAMLPVLALSGDNQLAGVPASAAPRPRNKFVNIAPAPAKLPTHPAMPWNSTPQPPSPPARRPDSATHRRRANNSASDEGEDDDEDFEESYEAKRARNNESVRKCRRKQKLEQVEQHKKLVCLERGAPAHAPDVP